MSWLKTLPIAYEGLLKDVRILNFSVPLDEIEKSIPDGLSVTNFQGRAMISLADLRIHEMRPKGFPKWLSLSYRHVALRLLVDAQETGERWGHPVYFLKSFCASACVICGGALFTDYHLQKAQIEEDEQVRLESGEFYLRYSLSGEEEANPVDLQRTARMNTAYAVHWGCIWQTNIKPDHWPIEPVTCHGFSTNLFKNARLEAAYKVKGNLCFERSAPLFLSRVQRREHVPPYRVRCSPL